MKHNDDGELIKACILEHFPNPAIGVLTKFGHLTGVVLRWGSSL